MNYPSIFVLAGLLTVPLTLRAAESGRIPIHALRKSVTARPESFELTISSHYSDDDFGFHMQTAPLSMDDSFFPRHRITADEAVDIIERLAATPFATGSRVGKRGDPIRPRKPEPVQRVFSLVLRCGQHAFFEDVQSDAEMAKRAEAIATALEGSSTAAALKAGISIAAREVAVTRLLRRTLPPQVKLLRERRGVCRREFDDTS